MKFLISAILTACIFGLTFSEPEKKAETIINNIIRNKIFEPPVQYSESSMI